MKKVKIAKKVRTTKHSKGTSKYALKKAQQAQGNYSPTSPFHVSEVEDKS